MTKAPTYHIRTIMDFTQVPKDRLDDCLREFRDWVGLCQAIDAVLEDVPVTWAHEFVWTDDGRADVSVVLSGPGGVEVARETIRISP